MQTKFSVLPDQNNFYMFSVRLIFIKNRQDWKFSGLELEYEEYLFL